MRKAKNMMLHAFIKDPQYAKPTNIDMSHVFEKSIYLVDDITFIIILQAIVFLIFSGKSDMLLYIPFLTCDFKFVVFGHF